MNKEFKFKERLCELMFYADEIKSEKLGAFIGISGQTIRAWCDGSQNITLSNIIKLANYFNCSLDFLTGRSDTVIDFKPKECPPFYPQFRKVMEERGKTRYSMDKETKIKDSYFTNWSKGKEPHIFSLIEVANYLDVSLDYLVGRD